jgi:predicted AlkP superfamily phosphohydrolase/phosphomutase
MSIGMKGKYTRQPAEAPRYTNAVRFLRMLTNSLLAGALGAAYLTVLVLQLNPQVPLVSDTTWRWYLTLCLFYGVHLAVTFYVAIVVREFFSLRVLSPGWASVRLLAWMGASAAAVAAVLMWLNVQGFHAALTEEASWRMTAGAIATTASAVTLLGISIAHYSFGRRGSRVGATLFLLAVCASLALPLAARGRAVGPGPPISAAGDIDAGEAIGMQGPRVVLLLLDGASLDYVLPRVAEGRLPAFARLLEKAAVMDLATIRPTQPDPVWAAVATGMYPSKNGVRSAASYYARQDSRPVDLLPDYCFSHALVHLGFIRDQPNAATTWRARPLWSIASQAGVSVGIARWPLTYPADQVDGFIVSDRFHQLVGSLAEFDRAAFPSEILPDLEDAFAPPPSETEPQLALNPLAEGTPEASAMRRDRMYSRAMRTLTARMTPRLTALRYDGLDTVGHYYFRYTQPRTFRDVPEEERRRFSQVIDRYYAFIDREVGTVLDALAPGDLLLIVSGFGMQPLNPVKATIGRLFGGADFSGTHDRAPDGFLIAFGAAAEPGRRQRGSIVDVTPTVLYFLGLPVARDMDGFARVDLFARAFTAERPIVFIPSYSY